MPAAKPQGTAQAVGKASLVEQPAPQQRVPRRSWSVCAGRWASPCRAVGARPRPPPGSGTRTKVSF